MPQSLSNVIIHLTFSTKGRAPWISQDIQTELNGYIAGIFRNIDCNPIVINSVSDHVHSLFAISRTRTLAEIVDKVKASSSRWMKISKKKFDFHWQSGYGAFSVSQSKIFVVQTYIKEQQEHHKKMTFMDEFLELLKRHEIAFDEKYLWD